MEAGSGFVPMSALAGSKPREPVTSRPERVSRSENSENPSSGRFSAEQKRRMKEEPGNPAAHRIVKIRRTVQVVLFSLFVLFFFLTTGTGTLKGVPKDFFMMIDFLVPLYHWILSHHLAVYALAPALFILVLTLWGGRIFCGWICPLGTLIDISDRFLYRKGRLFYNRRRTETRRFRNVKFIYLLVGLGAAVFGVDVLSYGDPLSLITRAFTFCVYGPVAYVWNGVLNGLDHLGLTDFTYNHFGWSMANWHLQTMVYQNNLAVLLLIVGVIALSSVQERFWCRNLCPYGALLGLVSRLSWLRHHIQMDGCIHCKKCEIQSRHGCYENLDKKAAGEVTHAITECIQCFRCETICPTDVIQIKSTPPEAIRNLLGHKKPSPAVDLSLPLAARKNGSSLPESVSSEKKDQPARVDLTKQGAASAVEELAAAASTKAPTDLTKNGSSAAPPPPKVPLPPLPQTTIDVGRRRLLGAIGGGLLFASAVKASATNYQGFMRRYPRNNKAMRPPGALPEREFLSACTRCAECMKVCPTNALQPAFLETGWEGIWTPLLVPSIGPCAEKCTACGDVCPTHAIRPFSWQDKRYKIKMGLANVDHNTCVAWNGGRDCIVCAEVCPYSAVIFRDVFDDSLPKDPTQPITAPGNKGRTKRVPTVDEKLCTGCGICEYHCPVLPNHSIIVYTFQEDREYKEPPERWTDGFYRGNWDARKERGKDREYAPTIQQIKEMKEQSGEL